MVEIRTSREWVDQAHASGRSFPESLVSDAVHPVDRPEDLAKLVCTLCTETFILDVAEYCVTPPEEMETLGRRFLGIHDDAPLCPTCLHMVQLTGAERIYWRLANA